MPEQQILKCRTVAVSVPGGPAQQYRVQVPSAANCGWRVIGSFRSAETAQSCVSDLQGRGVAARLIAHRLPPVAA